MTDRLNPKMRRRDFLRGSATLVGASVVGAGAEALAPAKVTLAVAYVDGQRLVSADRLSSADQGLRAVTVTVTVYDQRASLKAIDAIFPVKAGRDVRPTPYFAYTAGGVRKVRFTMPVEDGLEFAVRLPNGAAPLRLVTSGVGRKLREGTYVIAEGSPVWGATRVDRTDDEHPLRTGDGSPVPFSFALIDVEMA